MEWSNEETFNLIEYFKAKRILWDPKHPQYFNKMQKRDAWEDLSKEVEIPVVDVKKKMESLQAGVRREKAKMSRSISTGKGTEEIYTSTGFAYESMRFIWDKNKPRETLSNLQEEETTVGGSLNNGGEQLSASETSNLSNPRSELSAFNQNTPAPSMRPYTVTSASRDKKSPRTRDDPRLDKAFEMLQSAAAPLDDCYHFGNFVAAKLREFDGKTRMSVQSAMMTLLAQASEQTISLSSGNDYASTNRSVASTPTHPGSGITQFNYQSSDSSHNSGNLDPLYKPSPSNYPQPFVCDLSSQYQEDAQITTPSHSYEDEEAASDPPTVLL